ncbi:MAG TPA: helix-turn-helix domain-containing protein [Nitrososphaera sp.]|nr:helix-turn-helix domain-containing protein [Nitrososphaera sp.]
MEKTKRVQKIDTILSATVRLLAEKGYADTSIADIANHAKVYKSLLHYYFKDKEDLVSKALASSSNTMIQPAKETLSKVKSIEELVEGAIFFFKRDMEQNPDFFALVFETWCTGRRIARIKGEFNVGINHRIGDIKGVLESASRQNLIRVEDEAELEGLARIILALYLGLALQLIHNPDIKTNERMWNILKNILLAGLS